MLTRVLLAALLAGVLSGVFVTAVQAFRVTPLILQAETYENAGSDAHSHDSSASNTHGHGDSTAEAPQVWAPEDGMERTFYTMVSNILVGVSFSLILTAGVLLTKSVLTMRTGLVWGACGFVAFVLAPNFGLSPELPGMPAADLTLRQNWWFATVLSHNRRSDDICFQTPLGLDDWWFGIVGCTTYLWRADACGPSYSCSGKFGG